MMPTLSKRSLELVTDINHTHMLITEEQYRAHFDAILASGVKLTNGVRMEMMCPMCMRMLGNSEGAVMPTREDAPPKALGGKKIALTCKECNNTFGYTTDIHLLNFIKKVDQRAFTEKSDRRVKVLDGDNTINADLHIGRNKELTLEVNGKINDRRTLASILNSWDKDKILNFVNQPLKLNLTQFNSAALKSAYIILIAHIGYNVLLWDKYNIIRNQLKCPAEEIVPPLTTMQPVLPPDGIYVVNECGLRGFMVVYTLINPDSKIPHRMATLIPAPQTDFQSACFLLKHIHKGDVLKMYSISDIDYLNNPSNIAQLNRWANGDSFKYYLE